MKVLMPIMNPSLGDLGGGLKKPRKYRNVKCEWRGEKFDSKKELERHLVLLDMQKRGEISTLKRQPVWPLKVNGIKVCDYIPDWQYWDCQARTLVCEDAKGFATAEFKLKFKLAKACYPGDVVWRLS